MDIIKHRKIFFSISIILILISIIAIVIFGFSFGIDFVGGTLWQVKLTTNNQQLTIDNIRDFFEKDLEVKNATVYLEKETQSFLIRLGNISEEQHQDYLQKLKTKFNEVEELRYETIGPAIGKELRSRAIWAVILVLIGISLYVIYAFRKVSYPIKSWKYGIITLITLFHDALISTGLIVFLGGFSGVEFDTKFIIAILVIIGFSVHDTIVVFDRIRENLLINRLRDNLSEIVNKSVKQTIARSINTSLTLVLTLAALFVLGPFSLKYFTLVIAVGVVVGTYSSIFIASPFLTLWMGSGKS
ncbi:MAG: protein translocase subunit SecF [Patescibacteria group bacterium]